VVEQISWEEDDELVGLESELSFFFFLPRCLLPLFGNPSGRPENWWDTEGVLLGV